MLCFVMFCYVTLCYVTLRYVTLRFVMFCYVLLCFVMFCYVTLRYVTLRYVTLRYVKRGKRKKKKSRKHITLGWSNTHTQSHTQSHLAHTVMIIYRNWCESVRNNSLLSYTLFFKVSCACIQSKFQFGFSFEKLLLSILIRIKHELDCGHHVLANLHQLTIYFTLTSSRCC